MKEPRLWSQIDDWTMEQKRAALKKAVASVNQIHEGSLDREHAEFVNHMILEVIARIAVALGITDEDYQKMVDRAKFKTTG